MLEDEFNDFEVVNGVFSTPKVLVQDFSVMAIIKLLESGFSFTGLISEPGQNLHKCTR